MPTDLFSYSKNELSFKEIVDYAKMRQIIVAPEALMELDLKNYKDIIDDAVEKNLFIVNRDFVLQHKRERANLLPSDINSEQTQPGELPNKIVEVVESKHIYAKEIEPDIKLIHSTDITNKGSTLGKINEFYDYFRERFDVLGKILKERPKFDPINSKELELAQKNEEVLIIGMLYEKRITKKGNFYLVFDDLEGFFKVIVMEKDPILFDTAKYLANDDVVAIRGVKIGKDVILANEIMYPDLPNRIFKRAERDVYAIALSDIHLGSKLFFEKEFQKFVDWISLKNLNENEFKEVSKIKYIFVPGDIVDGIGVYPQQIDELEVIDIYQQYDLLANFFEQIPDYIHILITPGNHDAVRRADPQPAIPKEFAPRFYEMDNVYMLSSPVWAEVEGLKVLMYHGNSMNTLQNMLQIDHTKPEIAMKEYLKRRDLSSIYGERQPIVPEKGGYLLMKEEPDLFITGHLHHNGYDTYKGTLLINPGTWQDQTVYQREQGHIPTPGRVPVIKLKTGKITEKVFIGE